MKHPRAKLDSDMAWTNTQKQIGIRACKAAGIDDATRRDLIMRNMPHAHFKGQITSTSPKLNNHDFESFMSVIEHFAGGQVLHFTKGYWNAKAGDYLARMRNRTLTIAGKLEAAGKLIPGGVGLKGWIEKRVTGGVTDKIECLDLHQLRALILGLESYAGISQAKARTSAKECQNA
jgi:hypothetical protein